MKASLPCVNAMRLRTSAEIQLVKGGLDIDFKQLHLQDSATHALRVKFPASRSCILPGLIFLTFSLNQQPVKLPTMQTLLPHALAHLYGSGAVIIPPSRDPGATVHVPFALLPRKVRASVARAQPDRRKRASLIC